MKTKIKAWYDEIFNDENQYRQFYGFVFSYLKGDKTELCKLFFFFSVANYNFLFFWTAIEEAVMAWNLVLKSKPWSLFKEFEKFLTQGTKKTIHKDSWTKLWTFMQTFPKDLNGYTESGKCLKEILF